MVWQPILSRWKGKQVMTARIEPESFRDAMRRTASGVSVITTDGRHGRAGITVSTFQSFSMDPPSVMVCIHNESRNLVNIQNNGVFAANVLAAGQQHVARIFAGRSLEDREAFFEGGAWRALVTGAPVLRGALCSFDCRVADIFAFASHRIVIGAVQAIEASETEPLIYSGRAYRRLEVFTSGEDALSAKGELSIPL
jgi:flavin reductase